MMQSSQMGTVSSKDTKTFVRAIYGFNTTCCLLFESDSNPMPTDNQVVIMVDNSASMSGHRLELSLTLSSILIGTNAESAISTLRTSGSTAMVAAVKTVMENALKYDVIIITDGYENTFTGRLPVGPDMW